MLVRNVINKDCQRRTSTERPSDITVLSQKWKKYQEITHCFNNIQNNSNNIIMFTHFQVFIKLPVIVSSKLKCCGEKFVKH